MRYSPPAQPAADKRGTFTQILLSLIGKKKKKLAFALSESGRGGGLSESAGLTPDLQSVALHARLPPGPQTDVITISEIN